MTESALKVEPRTYVRHRQRADGLTDNTQLRVLRMQRYRPYKKQWKVNELPATTVKIPPSKKAKTKSMFFKALEPPPTNFPPFQHHLCEL
jgi:hypothetical protein